MSTERANESWGDFYARQGRAKASASDGGSHPGTLEQAGGGGAQLPEAVTPEHLSVPSGGSDVVVMVFGTGNNGKSTLLNALLGEYLLPSDEVVCTGNTTAIKRVQNAGGEEIALLQYGDTTVQEELGPASSRTEPRIKKDWVMDMDISEIQVQHAHGMFCDHGVTIMDVPGLDQDSLRTTDVADAMARSDMLFVVCAATSATGGGLTHEEKEELKEWQTDWETKWKTPAADQAFIVCNKMDAIPLDAAPIPRAEALDLLAHYSPTFNRGKKNKVKSFAEKRKAAEEHYEDEPDIAVDKDARPYKKPDESPLRQKLEQDAMELFGRAFVQQGGLHFVSAKPALDRAQHGDAQPEEFNTMRRCFLERVDKASLEKRRRLAAADARRHQEQIRRDQEAARLLAEAKAVSEEAESREQERQAEAERRRRQLEEERRARRAEQRSAERRRHRERVRQQRTDAAAAGAGVAGGVGAGTGAAVGVAHGLGVVAAAHVTAAGAVVAGPAVAATATVGAVGLGIGMVVKQAMFKESKGVTVNIRAGSGKWSCTAASAVQWQRELAELGMKSIELSGNRAFYTITIEVSARGSFAFQDAGGSVYKITCLSTKWSHKLRYKSKHHSIVRVMKF